MVVRVSSSFFTSATINLGFLLEVVELYIINIYPYQRTSIMIIETPNRNMMFVDHLCHI